MNKYVMALDQGTTSSRCIIFDKTGKICSMAQKEFSQIYPQPGWVEHNPMEIWSSQLSVATEAMAAIGADSEAISGIGITNQRETTILWDKKTGEPIYNAIVWQCRRTADMIDDLKADGFDEVIRKKNGTGSRCIFFCLQDRVDPGSCGRSERTREKGRNPFWNGRYLADLESDKGSGPCDRLYQCFPHDVV